MKKYSLIGILLLCGCSISTPTQAVDPHITNATSHDTGWLMNGSHGKVDTICSYDIYWSNKRLDTTKYRDSASYGYASTGYFVAGTILPKYLNCVNCIPAGVFNIHHDLNGEFEDKKWILSPIRQPSSNLLTIVPDTGISPCFCNGYPISFLFLQ